MARSHATQASAVMRYSMVVFALRHGAKASADPAREHAALDRFLAPFASLPFDDGYARRCAEIRRTLERSGSIIGPHDLQIAAIALYHGLTLVTHNTREFSRLPELPLDDWEL